jgi:hypothetical protein
MSDFVPALAIFCIFGLPIIAWVIIRILAHAERVEMIRRGIVPPPNGTWGAGGRRAWREWARTQQQQGGYAGAPWQQQSQTMTPPPPKTPPPGWYADDDAQTALFKGIRLALIGFAILIGLSFIGHGHGGPWLLGGLIPMFVGIAQIIIALLSGAQLPGVQSRTPYVGPGTMPPPSSPSGFNPNASAPPPWAQPGRQQYEEIPKPAQPPDLR